MSKLFSNHSVFYKYILTYTVIILISVLIVGLLLIQNSFNEIISSKEENAKNQLELIAKDLNNQLEVFKNIVYEIQIKKEYKPEYFLKNRFYETKLLDEFEKFKSWSPFLDDYFLYYEQSNSIFRSDGYKYAFEYMDNVYSFDNWSEIFTKPHENYDAYILSEKHKNQDYLIVSIPVKILSINRHQKPVSFVAIIRYSTFKERIKMITNLDAGSIYISHDSKNLTPLHIDYKSDDKNSIFETFLPNNTRTNIRLQVEDFDNDPRIIIFKRTNYIIILFSILSFLILGIYLAYINYKPIKKLSFSFDMPNDYISEKNELHKIESQLERLKKQQEKQKSTITQQSDLFLQHLINSIINEGYSDDFKKKLKNLNIYLDKEYTSVISLSYNGENDYMNIKNAIKKTQNEKCDLYLGIKNFDGNYSILANYSNKEEFAESIRKFIKILNNKNKAKIGLSMAFEIQKKDIIAANLEAQTALQKCIETDKDYLFFQELNHEPTDVFYDNEHLFYFVQALKNTKGEEATRLMSEIVNTLENNKFTPIYKKIMFSNLTVSFLNVCNQSKYAVNQSMLANLIICQSSEHFVNSFNNLIIDYCKYEKERSVSQLKQDIIKFIEDNATEYDMGLELLSEKFSLSKTHISRIVKDVTGTSFRRYIIELRMEKAVWLLSTTSLSVVEISQKVGYGSVSHFIKTFKTVTDCKPSDFR